jgi:type II secretory pathway predicted ATPase ExeA/septal ring-binding cell division protein DamX
MEKRNMGTFDSGQSPFSEAVNTQKFFPGANRHEVFKGLKSAIAESVTYITLTGIEGSGKTSMCRMIEKDLPAGYISVFFSERIDSFEEVTHTIAQKMRITLADGLAVGDIRELLLEVWERLSERKQTLLLIFDQADLIFLATLERIRKMLDIVNQTGIVFQILLSGRNGLLDNLKQLSLCSFQGAKERHFVLAPLDLSETYSYLNFIITNGNDDKKQVFTLDAAKKIFVVAGGNFRMTNTLAKETLGSVNADTSFMVLLDNVQDTFDEEQPKKLDFTLFKETYQAYKKWIIPAGAGLAVMIILLVMRMGGTPDINKNVQTPKGEKLTTEYTNPQKQPEEIRGEIDKTDRQQPQKVEAEKVEKETTQVSPIPSPPPPENTPVKKQAAEKISESQKVTTANTAQKMVKAEASPPKKVLIAEKTPPSQQAPPPPKASLPKQVPVEKIVSSRISATAKWLVGRENDYFTIQLMVLASDGAEKSLRKILGKKEYQEVVNRLYILRKASSKPNVFVFYGEYKTLDEARNASKTLPEFLLKHKPYVISVRGAVKKASES